MPRDIVNTVEEIYLSGSVSLGKCHKRTLKRWEKDINDYLERDECEWRVKANEEDCSLSIVWEW